MPNSETIRKQMLVAEVILLVGSLTQKGGQFVNLPSKEEFQMKSIHDLEEMKRELRILDRTIEGQICGS